MLSYHDIFIHEYESDLVKNHRLDKRQARDKATDVIQSSFPDNKPAKHHSIYKIVHRGSDDPRHVGFIWLLDTPAEKSVFVMDFYIFPEVRNQGLGFGALNALKSRLAKAGVQSLKLRVEPDNKAAIHLYDKAGFGVTGINMACKIESKDQQA